MVEHGFFNPNYGYWQTNDDVSEEVLAGYPRGTIEVQLKPAADYDFDGKNWLRRQPTLEKLRTAKIISIVAASDALLVVGAPVSGGLHVALDDRGLSDLSIMSGVATAAASGVVSWSESYARGWITIENVRISLATPADGLALAASVGNYYAAVVQHRRDLKDAALAAGDAATLEAIDSADGWPA